MDKKLFIIGLDSATPQLLFDQYRENLPNLSRLVAEGIYGELESTIPPITVPAWTSMLTSKDPGQLGIYGFRNRANYSYDGLYFANASHIKEKASWQYLSDEGFRSILLGVPQTYPPRPINGIIVSCFLSPNKDVLYTYPNSIAEELDRLADGEYLIDVKDFRTDNKEWLLDQIVLMTKRRFRVARNWAKDKDWDFFMLVEMGPDRIHHGFWRYADPSHRLYELGNPYEHTIRQYYELLDQEIGLLLQELPPDTSVMVVSDHGAKTMEGGFCINDWLIKEGYLVLKEPVSSPTKLTMDMIDWAHTKVWGEGGYYSRLFINVKGREPQGVVNISEYERFRESLRQRLEAILDAAGQNMGNRVFKPEEIYREVRNIAPDIIGYLGDLKWRSAGTVGNNTLYLYENDTGPDDANHATQGVFILYDPSQRLPDLGYRKGQYIEELQIYDIAPTILDYFGLRIPTDMIGRSIYQGKTEKDDWHSQSSQVKIPLPLASSPSPNSYISQEPTVVEEDYTSEDEEEISKRLEDLGYI